VLLKLHYSFHFCLTLSSRESVQGYGKICVIVRRKYDIGKDMSSFHKWERKGFLKNL
jgi:hypothetical protein